MWHQVSNSSPASCRKHRWTTTWPHTAPALYRFHKTRAGGPSRRSPVVKHRYRAAPGRVEGVPVFEVGLSNPEAVLGFLHDFHSLHGGVAVGDEIAGGGAGAAAHPPSQLMQLGEAKAVGMFHHHHRRLYHVYPHLQPDHPATPVRYRVQCT